MPDYKAILNDAYGATPEKAVNVAIAVYKDAGKYLNDIRKEAKKIVTDVIIETGQDKWNTEAGKVSITNPSVSARYDTKALDALCASDDKIKRLLWPHRKETERPGTMRIS